MPLSIAHLGPAGTYAEQAALAYANWYAAVTDQVVPKLCSCVSIAQTLHRAATGDVDIAVVPVENSIEGSVTMTLDTLWQLDTLQIQHALILPIVHVLVSRAATLSDLQSVFSHPQALGQCQQWLARHLPQVTLVAANSTTEALKDVDLDPAIGVISSQRAAQLYQLPILADAIQDHPENCTRFWVLSSNPLPVVSKTAKLGTACISSLAFSLPANVPGALLRPLQIFADRELNLSRIESRPSKRALGDYVFFLDVEAELGTTTLRSALKELAAHTDVLKVWGSYRLLTMPEINSRAT